MSNQSTTQPIRAPTMDHQNSEATVTGRLVPDRQLELVQTTAANTTAAARDVAADPAKYVMEITPDPDNTMTLPTGIDVDNAAFRVESADLILVLSDGSEIVVTGGAVNLPTFVIGDVKLPQATLFLQPWTQATSMLPQGLTAIPLEPAHQIRAMASMTAQSSTISWTS